MQSPTDISIEALSNDLANLIASRLEAASISSPLVVVDLFYHYADAYFPLVSYITIDKLRQVQATGDFKLYDLKEGPLELDSEHPKGQISKLLELDWNQDGLPDIGRRMIRQTAAIINNTRLSGRVATHDLFGAYAADGTVEGHSSEDWEEILSACGLPANQLTKWKRLGFF